MYNKESLSGKRGVRIKEDRYGINVLTMRNGYQWSGFPCDKELLLMLKTEIENYFKYLDKEKTNEDICPKCKTKNVTKLNGKITPWWCKNCDHRFSI